MRIGLIWLGFVYLFGLKFVLPCLNTKQAAANLTLEGKQTLVHLLTVICS